MQIDDHRVRRTAGRIGRVGEDAHAFLERMTPSLTSAAAGADGLGTATALRRVVDRLGETTTALARESRRLGEDVRTAADRHRANDDLQRRRFAALSPAPVSFSPGGE